MSDANDESSGRSSPLRRLLVWGGSLVGGLAVLVLVAALVLPRLFTSEELKGYVIPPLENATGREVQIDAIDLRVLPFPAVRLSGFQLANAEGYGPEPAVKARALSVDVALWPLFVGKIRPTAIALVAPMVRYEVAEDGGTNFESLGGPDETPEKRDNPLAEIPVSDFRVTGARLHYVDRGTGQTVRLDFGAQLNALPDGAAIASEGTVDLQTVRALLPSVGTDTLRLRDARVAYDLRATPAKGVVEVRSLQLETAPLTLTAAGSLSKLNDRPTIDLGVETGETNLAEIAAFVPAMAVDDFAPQGTLDLKATVSGPLSKEPGGDSDLTVSATGRLAGGGLDYQGAALLRNLSADLSLSLDDVTARSINGQMLGASLAGRAAVQGLRAEPHVDLDLKTGAMNLADLVAFVPPEQVGNYNPQGTLRLDVAATGPLPTTADALEQLAVNGTGQLTGFGIDYGGTALLRSLGADLSFSSDAVAARSVKGQLLGASLAGSAAVRGVRTEPQIDLDLETGPMSLADLVAFVPPEQVGNYNPQGTLRLDATVKGPMPEEVESLNQLVVNGTGELAGFGVDYDGRALLRSLRAALHFSPSSVSAQGIDGQLLGESLSGTVTVRDPQDTPQVEGQLAGAADLAELDALTDDGSDEQTPSVSGTADYDVQFSGPLEEPEALRPRGQVRLTDVQYPYESFRHPLEIPEATVQLTGTGLSMDRFTVRSGEQTAAVQTTVRDLFPVSKGLADTNPTMAATFTLTADRLDLVEFYSEGDTSTVSYSQLFAAHLAGRSVQGESPEALAEKIYGDTELPAYALDGRVEIGTLLNPPQRFDDLAFDLRVDDRRLTLRNLSASTYDGQLAGTLTLDQSESAAPSALTYAFQLKDANAGAVLADWTTLGRLVTGTLTFDVDGDTPLSRGLLPQVSAFTAAGQSVVVDGGLSLNLGPAKALTEALGLPVTSLKNVERLGGPFQISDGRFQVQTWAFGNERFDGQLQGEMALGGGLDLEMTLNLPLSALQDSKIPALVGGGDGQIGGLLGKLIGADPETNTVPVRINIGGTMQDPTVQVLNRDAIASRIRSLAQEAGLDLLRGLFDSGGGK